MKPALNEGLAAALAKRGPRTETIEVAGYGSVTVRALPTSMFMALSADLQNRPQEAVLAHAVQIAAAALEIDAATLEGHPALVLAAIEPAMRLSAASITAEQAKNG